MRLEARGLRFSPKLRALVRISVAELHAFGPSQEEPSVWVPREPGLLDVNFIGMGPAAAYIASPDDARQLVAEGGRPEPAGEEFDPFSV